MAWVDIPIQADNIVISNFFTKFGLILLCNIIGCSYVICFKKFSYFYIKLV
jgi:hypothetical protein